MQGATYTFSAKPEPVIERTDRQKYRSTNALAPSQFSTTIPNIMADPRVVRGNTHAKMATAYSPPMTATVIKPPQKKSAPAPRARTPPPVAGRVNTQVQTVPFVENLSRKTVKNEISTQTVDDEFDVPATSEPFVPLPSGTDAATLIEDDDLFDFEMEAEPVVHVLVTRTIEDALRAVLDEEEMKAIMDHKTKWETQRNFERGTLQRMSARAHRRDNEKRNARLDEIKREAEEAKKEREALAQQLAREYVASIEQSVYKQMVEYGNHFEQLFASGQAQPDPQRKNPYEVFYDTTLREVKSSFLPWLAEKTYSRVRERADVRKAIDSLMTSATQNLTATSALAEAEARVQVSTVAADVVCGVAVVKSPSPHFALTEDAEGLRYQAAKGVVTVPEAVDPPSYSIFDLSVRLMDDQSLAARQSIQGQPLSEREADDTLLTLLRTLIHNAEPRVARDAQLPREAAPVPAVPAPAAAPAKLQQRTAGAPDDNDPDDGSDDTPKGGSAGDDNKKPAPLPAGPPKRKAFDINDPVQRHRDYETVVRFLKNRHLRRQFDSGVMTKAEALEALNLLTVDIGFTVGPVPAPPAAPVFEEPAADAAVSARAESALEDGGRATPSVAPVPLTPSDNSSSFSSSSAADDLSAAASDSPAPPPRDYAAEREKERQAVERFCQGASVDAVSLLGRAVGCGVVRGDVILSVGGETVTTPDDFHRIISAPRLPGSTVELVVRRQSDHRICTLQLEIGASGSLFSPDEIRRLRETAQLDINPNAPISQSDAATAVWQLRPSLGIEVEDISDEQADSIFTAIKNSTQDGDTSLASSSPSKRQQQQSRRTSTHDSSSSSSSSVPAAVGSASHIAAARAARGVLITRISPGEINNPSLLATQYQASSSSSGGSDDTSDTRRGDDEDNNEEADSPNGSRGLAPIAELPSPSSAAARNSGRNNNGVSSGGVTLSSDVHPLRVGERIVMINDTPVDSVGAFLQALHGLVAGDKITLTLDTFDEINTKTAREAALVIYEAARAEKEKKNKRRVKKGLLPEPEPPTPEQQGPPLLVRRSLVLTGSYDDPSLAPLVAAPDSDTRRDVASLPVSLAAHLMDIDSESVQRSTFLSREWIACLRRLARLPFTSVEDAETRVSRPVVQRSDKNQLPLDARVAAHLETVKAAALAAAAAAEAASPPKSPLGDGDEGDDDNDV